MISLLGLRTMSTESEELGELAQLVFHILFSLSRTGNTQLIWSKFWKELTSKCHQRCERWLYVVHRVLARIGLAILILLVAVVVMVGMILLAVVA